MSDPVLTKEQEQMKTASTNHRKAVIQQLIKVLEGDDLQGVFLVAQTKSGDFIDHTELVGLVGEAVAFLGRIDCIKTRLALNIDQVFTEAAKQQAAQAAKDAARAQADEKA